MSEKISVKFSKLKIGMNTEKAISAIGEPDRKNLIRYGIFTKSFLKNDQSHTFFPDEFIDGITDESQIWLYNYPVENDRITAFCLFFDRRDRLIGVSCSKQVLPKNWDEIKNNLTTH